jgi:hypothetical protein
VATSWREFYGNCKSRISAIARSCYLGRQRLKEKHLQVVQELKAKMVELEKAYKAQEAMAEQLRMEREEALERVVVLEQKLAEETQPIRLPDDPPAPGQQYGASLMALSINLAREVGLRKSVRAMKTFFKWLRVKPSIPSYQAVRTWMQRLGLNRMRRAKRRDDRIWIVDLSNQIGQERCLTVLGIEQSKLPPPGTPLKLTDMITLGFYPAKKWNRENVSKIYNRLAKRFGYPVAAVTDGAVELREPLESLEKDGKTPRSIRDLKHFLANRFEETLGQDKRYQEFTNEVNQTRSAVQQTEVSHLTPPVMRQKARFMNMAPLLKWSSMVLWQLTHTNSDGRKGITAERLQSKLGWLSHYKDDVERWSNLQEVISTTLTFMNANGLSPGITDQLKAQLKDLPQTTVPCELIASTLKFVREHEQKLEPDERLPMSSEILESGFSRFKALEQQHARSGFTQLVLAFPCLLKPTTASEIRRVFIQTKVKDTKQWVQKHLPKTHDARRLAAYTEYRKDLKQAKSQNSATTLAATG